MPARPLGLPPIVTYDSAAARREAVEVLFDLAARIELDGGLPGKDPESRAAASAVALMALVWEGHTLRSGRFRTHVSRLMRFLKTLRGLPAHRQETLAAVLQLVRQGNVPARDWIVIARDRSEDWTALEGL